MSLASRRFEELPVPSSERAFGQQIFETHRTPKLGKVGFIVGVNENQRAPMFRVSDHAKGPANDILRNGSQKIDIDRDGWMIGFFLSKPMLHLLARAGERFPQPSRLEQVKRIGLQLPAT